MVTSNNKIPVQASREIASPPGLPPTTFELVGSGTKSRYPLQRQHPAALRRVLGSLHAAEQRLNWSAPSSLCEIGGTSGGSGGLCLPARRACDPSSLRMATRRLGISNACYDPVGRAPATPGRPRRFLAKRAGRVRQSPMGNGNDRE